MTDRSDQGAKDHKSATCNYNYRCNSDLVSSEGLNDTDTQYKQAGSVETHSISEAIVNYANGEMPVDHLRLKAIKQEWARAKAEARVAQRRRSAEPPLNAKCRA
jgi:hypothetical protein